MSQFNDASWLRQAFILPSTEKSLTPQDKIHRNYSAAFTKFTDTTPGGNFTINNPPQPCRNADRKNLALRKYLKQEQPNRQDSKGMGRYYSEAYDDNSVKVHLSFGVPEFNSITRFFSNFYDPEMGLMARTGETGGLAYDLGKAVGWLVSAPLIPFVMAGSLLRFLSGKPSAKYYYVKPTMGPYWNAVNIMANKLAVNIGIQDGVFGDTTYDEDTSSLTKAESGSSIHRADYSSDTRGSGNVTWKEYSKILPKVFRKEGGIDVYAMATRAQRMHDAQLTAEINAIESAKSQVDLENKLRDVMNMNFDANTNKKSIKEYTQNYRDSKLAAVKEAESSAKAAAPNPETFKSDDKSFVAAFQAELRDGSNWVAFRLDEAGSIGESFNNTTKEPSIAATINGISAKAQEARVNTMNLNLGAGVIGDTLKAFMGAATDVAMGLADGVGLSGLAVLGGGAYADIQNVWDNSSASLPTESFTIQLRTPYGNKVSIFQNLYMPLAMLLAGALPLSTGPSSYTSPFMCQCFVPGRMQTRCGMITDLSITRGTSNAGWSVDGLPLGIDITFTVTDMSSIMHVPLDERAGILDDDNAFNDYMAVLGALGIAEQFYPVQKLKRNMATKYRQFESMFSTAHTAQWAAGTMPGRVMSAFYKGSAAL
jgi:hypothetical protein